MAHPSTEQSFSTLRPPDAAEVNGTAMAITPGVQAALDASITDADTFLDIDVDGGVGDDRLPDVARLGVPCESFPSGGVMVSKRMSRAHSARARSRSMP